MRQLRRRYSITWTASCREEILRIGSADQDMHGEAPFLVSNAGNEEEAPKLARSA